MWTLHTSTQLLTLPMRWRVRLHFLAMYLLSCSYTVRRDQAFCMASLRDNRQFVLSPPPEACLQSTVFSLRKPLRFCGIHPPKEDEAWYGDGRENTDRASGFDWGLCLCAPLSPGAVIDADIGIAQQIPQNHCSLTGAGTYGAVGDDAAFRVDTMVMEQSPQLCRALECAISSMQQVDVQMDSSRDVARTTGTCRGTRWPESLPDEFCL